MTFTEIVDEAMTRLNLSSAAAQARIGSAVNHKYKEVTSSIGLNVTRRTQVQSTVTLGVQELVFADIEKVLTVIDKSSGQNRILTEITVDEMRERTIGTGSKVQEYAILKMDAHEVTILMDTIPQTSFTLYADGYERALDLSGSQEPAFPESFHGLLVESVMADELRKMEKIQLANIARDEATRLLSDLRMFIAKSAWSDIYQGKKGSSSSRSGGGSGSGSGTVNGASSYTQTGLITFDRDPAAPFAVSAGSAKVTNLDADFLDGETASAFHNASNLSAGTLPDGRFPATLPAASGVNLTALNASNLSSGIVPDARIPGLTTDASSKIRNIAFPATQVASADGNTLDDYEEGQWTPALKFGGNSVGMTGTFEGWYVKVGQMVQVSLRIVLTAKGSSTGTATITGLPFTTNNLWSTFHAGYFGDLNISVASFSGYAGGASTTITLVYVPAAGAVATTGAGENTFSNTTTLIMSGVYRASA